MPEEVADNVNSKLNLKRAGRKRRAAGWTLLTLGVLVAGVWVASGWWYSSLSLGTRTIAAYGGIVDVEFFTGTSDPDVEWRCVAGERLSWASRADVPWLQAPNAPPPDKGTFGIGRGAWSLVYCYTEMSWIHHIRIALWPVPLLLWTPAALLLRSGILARRRAMKGACAKCGYSLAGLAADAPCPECGRRAANK